MNKQVRILPGTPDDANREYLPERIKTTDIVVNENGNNSIVYPEHLQEFHGVVADGLEDEWYEYVPESYDPSRPVPLVIGLHGGLRMHQIFRLYFHLRIWTTIMILK